MKKLIILIGIVLSSNLYSSWPAPKEILEVVNKSPLYVARHEKEQWLGLFSEKSHIEDPVGAYHFNKSEQAKFWDAFIAENNITFEIKRDYFLQAAILRDANVVTYNPKSKTTVITPAYLRYNVVLQDNRLKIKSLEAYWSFPNVTSSTLKRGKEGLKILSTQLAQIRKGLGNKITIKHFTKGLTGGFKGDNVKLLNKFLNTVNNRNLNEWQKTFHENLAVIANDKTYNFSEFFNSDTTIIDLEKTVFSGKNIVFDGVFQNGNSAKLALIALKYQSGKIIKIEIFE